MAEKGRFSPTVFLSALASLCIFVAGCTPSLATRAGDQPTVEKGIPQPAASKTPEIPVPTKPSTSTPTSLANLFITRTPIVLATRTPGAGPAPSATPIPASLTDRSFSQANPGEIIEELYDFGKGGGPGEGPCLEAQPKPVFEAVTPKAELMEVIPLHSCGWLPGEMVVVDARDPSGKSLAHFTVQADPGGADQGITMPPYIALVYQPSLSDPTGNYTFTLQGRRGTLAQTVQVTRPNGPRIYLPNDNRWEPVQDLVGKRGSVLLWNFVPGEKARLVIYSGRDFLGYQDYIIPHGGQLLVEIHIGWVADEERLDAVVRGSASGTVTRSSFFDADEGFYRLAYLSCEGAMPPHITAKVDRVRAAFVNGSRLRIREKPGFSGAVLQSVPEGTVLELEPFFHSVVCMDETFWWRVVLPGSSDKGWVAESQEGVYLLEPMEQP